MASNFEIAALDSILNPSAAKEITAEIGIKVAGRKYVSLWRRPTPGQYAMYTLRSSRGTDTAAAVATDHFFTNLILTPEEVVADGRVDEFDVEYEKRFKDSTDEEPVGYDWFIDLIERGAPQTILTDALAKATEQFAGFPTSSSSGSSSSPTESGPPSTARSRRQGSTRSS